jgi:phage baseplate assembly protein V
MQSGDRLLAPVFRRLDMMFSRGVLRATVDENGVQTMQVGLLEDEVADEVERVQSYGLSAVPPNGGDAVVAFISGNRDHGMVLAVNDRESRPREQKGGEVTVYNNKKASIKLDEDGNIVITVGQDDGKMTIKVDDEISIEAKKLTIKIEDEITIECPTIKIEGDIELDGNLNATGRVTWGQPGGGPGPDPRGP